jgi:molybdopterin converting factor subunit 1
MILNVQLFARARDLAGTNRLAVDLADGATVADLRLALAATQPRLAAILEQSAVAVNSDFAGAQQRLNPNDDIALLPPVSGG